MTAGHDHVSALNQKHTGGAAPIAPVDYISRRDYDGSGSQTRGWRLFYDTPPGVSAEKDAYIFGGYYRSSLWEYTRSSAFVIAWRLELSKQNISEITALTTFKANLKIVRAMDERLTATLFDIKA